MRVREPALILIIDQGEGMTIFLPEPAAASQPVLMDIDLIFATGATRVRAPVTVQEEFPRDTWIRAMPPPSSLPMTVPRMNECRET